jgi:hypothetical protein
MGMYPWGPYSEQYGEFQARSAPGLSSDTTARVYFDGTDLLVSKAGGAYGLLGSPNFTVPVTVTPTGAGPLTGLSVNMTSATGLTTAIQGFSILGAATTAAKAASQATLMVLAQHSKMRVLGLQVRNKSAKLLTLGSAGGRGSIFSIGWDTTDFAGTPSTSSVLDDQTVCVTIDGQSNVNAFTNSVDFRGIYLLVPRTTNGSAAGIQIDSQLVGGSVNDTGGSLVINTSPATANSLARAILVSCGANQIGKALDLQVLHKNGTIAQMAYNSQVSLDGALTGMLLDFTDNVTAGANKIIAVDISLPNQSAANSSTGVRIRRFVGTESVVAASNYTGSLIDLQNTPTLASTCTEASTLVNVNHAPSNNTGTDSTTGIAVAMTPSTASSTARGIAVTMGANSIGRGVSVTHNGALTGGSQQCFYAARTCTPGSGITYAGSLVKIENLPVVTNNSTDSSSLLFINHGPSAGGGTLTDTAKGIQITMSPNTSSAVVGILINMGANTSASGAGIQFGTGGPSGLAHVLGPTDQALKISAGSAKNLQLTVTAGTLTMTNDTGLLSFAGSGLTSIRFKQTSEAVNAATYTASGTTTLDLSLGNVHTATAATGGTTWAFTNPDGSGYASSFTLVLTNGGSQTQTWPGSVKWPGGSAPTFTTSGVDILTFFTTDGGTTWRGALAQADSK